MKTNQITSFHIHIKRNLKHFGSNETVKIYSLKGRGWGGDGEGVRRVLKNTPSKHKQLGRSLCIIVILSLHCTGVALALFQVHAFDRLYLDTLNNICYHICVYIRWTNYFKFNVFFTCCCYVWVMWHLLFFSFIN